MKSSPWRYLRSLFQVYFLICAGIGRNSRQKGEAISFSGCTPTCISPSSASSGHDDVNIKGPLKALYGERRHVAIATSFHIGRIVSADLNCGHNS
ncbi:hypothetical protein XELAEV_18012261mg [Xenopus laevis]|uniref:Uncharacterized protein n=1 Tax=Xenopus laevis TaxID=8355 RepID=A0A974DME3_XENLA|nr:hypothetical protein XELAEV_18012261mg [Xenopus laevis]